MKVIAAILSVTHLILFVLNLMLSVHGSALLPWFTFCFLIIALVSNWYLALLFIKSGRKLKHWLWFCVISIILILINLSLSQLTIDFELKRPPFYSVGKLFKLTTSESEKRETDLSICESDADCGLTDQGNCVSTKGGPATWSAPSKKSSLCSCRTGPAIFGCIHLKSGG